MLRQEDFGKRVARICHRFVQGPLITHGQNSSKWTGPNVGLSKSFIRVKISENYFLMDSFIDRRSYRSHFLHKIGSTL